MFLICEQKNEIKLDYQKSTTSLSTVHVPFYVAPLEIATTPCYVNFLPADATYRPCAQFNNTDYQRNDEVYRMKTPLLTDWGFYEAGDSAVLKVHSMSLRERSTQPSQSLWDCQNFPVEGRYRCSESKPSMAVQR